MESALCTLLSALVVLLCSSPECKGEDTVSQPAGDVLLTQGDTVEIECSFETNDNAPTLFWYKQEGRGAPKNMMKKTRSVSKWLETHKSPELNDKRFKVEAKDNSFHLLIQDVDVTDSAVYYCALRPTVTGNTKTLNKNLWSKDNTILQCEELTALKPEVCAEQGKQVSLEYEYYKDPVYGDYFFWYRQYPGKPPEFLVSHSGKGDAITEKVKGLEFSVRDKSVSLLLSSAAVGDSAVYYCAVRPTVTANPQSLNKSCERKQQYSTRPLEGDTGAD
ncbi:hypothetical protein WMY93_000061 [Mugilogobius chulae]|uniref:Ig-like domain-containing protein n=1 Tax=Mugilogobius chulae TaxID=88201 RepID=A0AAW0PZ82_9GOBI